ncbi:MAG: terpene cyclase/mutase family protein [Kiritimatiellae bacterium]|jgi:squalene-hopene/tetraprenyl-beta-curcumene cyclase|nr:terpene cyclase/mutase family protein [Kiritimatiellia bacterium]
MNKVSIILVAAAMLTVYSNAEDITSSQAKGTKWLVEQQRENGSWSNESYPAMTALGLWALTNSSDYEKQKQMAADFIAGFAQTNGGIYKIPTGGRGSGGLSTYNTAICMTALYKYNKVKYRNVILAARKFVAASQLQGDSHGSGGFGYNLPSNNSTRDRPDLSNTAWVLQAMRATQDLEEFRKGEKVDIDWEQAKSYVEKLQIQDGKDKGAFGYSETGERTESPDSKEPLRTFGSMTYAGLESLIFADVKKSDPMIISTIEWVGKNWSLDENPGMGVKGLFYYYNVLSKSLELYGGQIKLSDGKTLDWQKDLQDKLISKQKPDGSWVNSDGQFWETDPILVTSYCLISLSYTK